MIDAHSAWKEAADMVDVSRSYGVARGGEPLSEQQQARLRELSGKTSRTPLEKYELGALTGRGWSTQQGRQVLKDVGHDQAAGRVQRQRSQRSEKDQRKHNLAVIDSVLGED
jgi:hypothetical protein